MADPLCYADNRTDEILRIVAQVADPGTEALAAMREPIKAVVIMIETDLY